MTIKDVENILSKFSEKHNLKKEALISCRVAMSNCVADDPEGLGGFRIEEVRLEFVQQEMIFEHYFYNTPFVKTRIGLYKNEENEIYVRNLEPIGYYELDTDLEGESFDDWLIIDEEKNNQMEIVYDLKGLNKVLPDKYLRRNSIYYEYISYIAHVATLYQARDLRACQFFMKRAFEFSAKTEVKDDFKEYIKKSKKYIKRIASYLYECELLEEDLIVKFEELEILKRKANKK